MQEFIKKNLNDPWKNKTNKRKYDKRKLRCHVERQGFRTHTSFNNIQDFEAAYEMIDYSK